MQSVSRSWRPEEQGHAGWRTREQHLAAGEIWACLGGWVTMFPGGGPGEGTPGGGIGSGEDTEAGKCECWGSSVEQLTQAVHKVPLGLVWGPDWGRLSCKAEGVASSLRSERGRAENSRAENCHSRPSFLLPTPSSSTLRALYTHPAYLHQAVTKILLWPFCLHLCVFTNPCRINSTLLNWGFMPLLIFSKPVTPVLSFSSLTQPSTF